MAANTCCNKCANPRTPRDFFNNHLRDLPQLTGQQDCPICQETFTDGKDTKKQVGFADPFTGYIDIACQVVGLQCNHVIGKSCIARHLNLSARVEVVQAFPVVSNIDGSTIEPPIVCPLCRAHWATPANFGIPSHLEEITQASARAFHMDYDTARGFIRNEPHLTHLRDTQLGQIAGKYFVLYVFVEAACRNEYLGETIQYLQDTGDSDGAWPDLRLIDPREGNCLPPVDPFDFDTWCSPLTVYVSAIFRALSCPKGQELITTYVRVKNDVAPNGWTGNQYIRAVLTAWYDNQRVVPTIPDYFLRLLVEFVVLCDATGETLIMEFLKL